ncbi:MAG: acetolactate synthase, partial [Acidimicrobiales bacterium]
GWGRGALQELDHLPIVAPLVKEALTVEHTDEIAAALSRALAAATTPHRGPAFVDIPLDVLYGRGRAAAMAVAAPSRPQADPDQVAAAARLLAGASRPALVAGGDVWWEGAWEQLRAAAEALRVPTFTNGLGRGCLPVDHELAFARSRSMLGRADVVAVVGTPIDFRLAFGAFGGAALVHVVDDAETLARHVELAARPAGDLRGTLAGLAEWPGPRVDHEEWISLLRQEESARRQRETELLESDAEPIHPARVYGELRRQLDPDAVVAGDGGDFVSWAGRLLDSRRPGCWLDPGPYGCLGTGPGYALAARIAHPDRQVVLCSGDGAFGFAGMDLDTLVRHRAPVVVVVGNNGIWGLEKHPMRDLFGHDVAADLQPGCRYDSLCADLGGAGETVSTPTGIGPALRRAFQSGVPYVLNVLIDPEVRYPRSSSLV